MPRAKKGALIRKFAITVALCAGLGSSPASAEWLRYSTGVEGIVWSINPSSIKKKRDVKTIWVKSDDPRKPGYMLLNFGYDCADWTSETHHVAIYLDNGTLVEQENGRYASGYSIGYEPIVPGSIDERIAKWVCGVSG